MFGNIKSIAAGLLAALAIAVRMAAGQGVDPQIQSQVDQFVQHPTGDELIIKSEPATKKKPHRKRTTRENARELKLQKD